MKHNQPYDTIEQAHLTSDNRSSEVTRVLRAAGVNVTKTTKRHNTRVFVCDFYSPGMEQGVDSAATWWQRIRAALPNAIPARYKHLNDTHADWREGNPIIWACVKFNLPDESEA